MQRKLLTFLGPQIMKVKCIIIMLVAIHGLLQWVLKKKTCWFTFCSIAEFWRAVFPMYSSKFSIPSFLMKINHQCRAFSVNHNQARISIYYLACQNYWIIGTWKKHWTEWMSALTLVDLLSNWSAIHMSCSIVWSHK